MTSEYRDSQLLRGAMVGAVVGQLRPKLPCRVRFMAGMDDEYGAYLGCFAVGPEVAGDRQVIGALQYASGLQVPAQPVAEARCQEIIDQFDLQGG